MEADVVEVPGGWKQSAEGLLQGCKINAEVTTHFTKMLLLLLCLQWQKGCQQIFQ